MLFKEIHLHSNKVNIQAYIHIMERHWICLKWEWKNSGASRTDPTCGNIDNKSQKRPVKRVD